MSIQIIRGRTLRVAVSLKLGGDPYIPQEGETTIMTVKRSIWDDEPLIVKTGTEIVFNPADTADLAPGHYVYDVVLQKANGDLYTVIPAQAGHSDFVIVRGVYDYE